MPKHDGTACVASGRNRASHRETTAFAQRGECRLQPNGLKLVRAEFLRIHGLMLSLSLLLPLLALMHPHMCTCHRCAPCRQPVATAVATVSMAVAMTGRHPIRRGALAGGAVVGTRKTAVS